MLRAILEKNIRLIDYEVIVDDAGKRLIAFGFYAGIVGAHNGLWSYGQRTGLFSLSRLHACHDYAEALEMYSKTVLPPVKILLTGGGRVASGAVKNLTDMGIKAVNPADFLTNPTISEFLPNYTPRTMPAEKTANLSTNPIFMPIAKPTKAVLNHFRRSLIFS